MLLSTVHPGNAGIGLNALLELVVGLNHSVADLVNLIALPGDRQQHLAAFAPTRPSSPCGSPFGTGSETSQP